MDSATSRYVQVYHDSKHELPGLEVPWVARTRNQAIDTFDKTGFPTKRNEDWKYTPVTPVETCIFRLPNTTVGTSTLFENEQNVHGLGCYSIAFLDGQLVGTIDPQTVPKGVQISSISTALSENYLSAHTHLTKHANINSNGFCALNTAMMHTGAVIQITANTTVDRPIMLTFISSGQMENVATYPRILVTAGTNTEVQIIERYVGLGSERYFTNHVSEIVLEENARMEHYKIQEETQSSFHVSTMQIHQDRDSHFVSHSISLGGNISRHDINSTLSSPGANCHLYGLYLAKERQHVDYHTRINHLAPHCLSKEIYKGILDGHARGVFNGQVRVNTDAQKTNAEQANDNLLLSTTAEINTKPQLEIFADDVKCSHGATVGQLDDDMIFYLCARGIDKMAARNLLTYGFANNLLEQMDIKAINEYVSEKLLTWLPSGKRLIEIMA